MQTRLNILLGINVEKIDKPCPITHEVMEHANEWRVQYSQTAWLILYVLVQVFSGLLVLIVFVSGHCLRFAFNGIMQIKPAMVVMIIEDALAMY